MWSADILNCIYIIILMGQLSFLPQIVLPFCCEILSWSQWVSLPDVLEEIFRLTGTVVLFLLPSAVIRREM